MRRGNPDDRGHDFSASTCEHLRHVHSLTVYQDVFIIPDGAAGALAELERRKFTAEEGVRAFSSNRRSLSNLSFQDHLTLLNGTALMSSLDTGIQSDYVSLQHTMPLSGTANPSLGVNPMRSPSVLCPELCPSARNSRNTCIAFSCLSRAVKVMLSASGSVW